MYRVCYLTPMYCVVKGGEVSFNYPPRVCVSASHLERPRTLSYQKIQVGGGDNARGTMRKDKHLINALAELIVVLYREHEPRKKRAQFWRFSFQDYPLLLQVQENLMPRGKKVTTNNVTPNGISASTATEWVNVRFSAEQVQEVLHLSENPEEVGKALAGLLVQGFGFSVRANTDRANFSAFITNIPAENGAKLYAISGFAPSAMGAIAAVLTKYYAILDNPALLSAAKASVGIG